MLVVTFARPQQGASSISLRKKRIKMKIPVFNINSNLIKSDNFFNDARNLIMDDKHLNSLISSIVDTYRIRECFQKLGNIDDFNFSFLDQGYVKNNHTGEFFAVRVNTYGYDDDILMNFGLDFTHESEENDVQLKTGYMCGRIFINPLSSKNPKIYLQENASSTEKIKCMGIPIRMSKGSQKFKSRPYVWASDIFKRAKSRI